MRMDNLFENEKFAVLHFLARDHEGFEIVNKRTGQEVYIEGDGVDLVRSMIIAWEANIPSEQQVEDFLKTILQIAHLPLHVH